MDNKSVKFLSNFHDPYVIVKIGRRQKDKTILQITSPQIVYDYNSYMDCVDKAQDILAFC